MKSLVLALSLVTSVAFAETAKISIEGMHCAGCKDMLTKKVCGDEAMVKATESCEVTVTDAAKHTGEITIVSKGEEKVDVELVKRQLSATGEGYKIANVEVKNMKKMNADGTAMTDAQLAEATAAMIEKVPGTKTVTTTTVTEIVGADGKVEVKKEVKVKKMKVAKTSSKKATK